MDVISDLLGMFRFENASFGEVEARAPWGIRSDGVKVIKFFSVTEGQAVMKVDGIKMPIQLTRGDVFMIFDKVPFLMGDTLKSQMSSRQSVKALHNDGNIKIGGKGLVTRFIGGRFDIDPRRAKPLFEVLPKFVHLKLDQNRSHAFQSILETLILEVAHSRTASSVVISRLIEILFIYSIRAYASETSSSEKSWLFALNDTQIGKTLRAVHERLAEPWTVEAMADEAGLSRSAFASRFKNLTGQSPLEYVTRWRMHKAAYQLSGDDSSLIRIAEAVGYNSQSAFNRAFKRTYGVTPGQFKRSS